MPASAAKQVPATKQGEEGVKEKPYVVKNCKTPCNHVSCALHLKSPTALDLKSCTWAGLQGREAGGFYKVGQRWDEMACEKSCVPGWPMDGGAVLPRKIRQRKGCQACAKSWKQSPWRMA
eukprot:69843-Chlamydomonas_euryale.AAC.1